MAELCRRFLIRILGSFACLDSVSKRDDTVSGCQADPSACVNTNPESDQAAPITSFCSACRQCKRRSASTTSESRTPVRADRLVFGFDSRASSGTPHQENLDGDEASVVEKPVDDGSGQHRGHRQPEH